MCEERDASGGNVTRRFFARGEQNGGTNYFFTRDHLGSVREMTDTAGILHARYDYDPYGRRTKVLGDLDTDFGFTGHYTHTVSGLCLTMFRAYDANWGRWLSRDPLEEFGDLNLYAFVGNTPLHAVDPLGLCGGTDPNWAMDAAKITAEVEARNVEALRATIINGAVGLAERFPVLDPLSDEGIANLAIRHDIQHEMNAAGAQLQQLKPPVVVGGVGAVVNTVATIGSLPASGTLLGSAGAGVAAAAWVGVAASGGIGYGVGRLIGHIGPKGNEVDDYIQRFFRWAVTDRCYAQ